MYRALLSAGPCTQKACTMPSLCTNSWTPAWALVDGGSTTVILMSCRKITGWSLAGERQSWDSRCGGSASGACSPNHDACFRHSMGESGAEKVEESRGLSQGNPLSIPCPIHVPFWGCGVELGEGWEMGGQSHLNLLCSWAFFRTSSKEEPTGTETECLYEGKMLETFSVTWMSSGTWVCEGVSVAGSNRTVPGRGEGAAGLRAGGQALVLLSSLEDTVAH